MRTYERLKKHNQYHNNDNDDNVVHGLMILLSITLNKMIFVWYGVNTIL